MSQADIDAQQDKTTAGKFTTCIAFAGQKIHAAPRPKNAPQLPKFSGPNDYREVNPAAKQSAKDVFPDGTWHNGDAGMTDRRSRETCSFSASQQRLPTARAKSR